MKDECPCQKEIVRQSKIHSDSLTGLYDGHSFLVKVEELKSTLLPNVYCMAAIDIEHFRLFNKLYGRKAGDGLIVCIAECIKNLLDKHTGIAGYLGGDNFGILLPDFPELMEQLRDDIIRGLSQWDNTIGFFPIIGVYPISDPTASPEEIYDRATIALSHVLGNCPERICRYEDSMETKLEEELRLLSEIQTALEHEEFTFYAQPQCDISTGKIVGAEALVRWNHATKGLISPGIFIPVLERNGIITHLDKYVWRRVCEWLQSWIDRGYHPVPVSINVSRIDIFSIDVPAYLSELMHTYQLSEKLLKVEITESAYADSNDKINETVQKLRDQGFIVMMDDFGSGYSSLNMLKDISVDVLKLDMRFLNINESDSEKGIGILESIVNMARLMRLPIIVEGVETQQQEKFLLTMGCRYTQGYYYYRPLPIDQFETLLTDEDRLDFNGLWYKQVEPLHIREFLDNNFISDMMLNNMLGPIAFYEMHGNQIEVTRVNEQYFRFAGNSANSDTEHGKQFWNHVQDDDRSILFTIFEQAYENPVTGADGYIHFLRMDGTVLWVYIKVFFLKEKDGHRLFYSSLTDMTALQDKAEQKKCTVQKIGDLSEEQLRRLEKYYGSMPCGYAVGRILVNDAGRPYDYEISYANQELINLSSGSIKYLKKLITRSFRDHQPETLDKAYRAAYLGESIIHYAYNSISGRYLQFNFYQYEYGYVACVLNDVTHMHIYENALKSIMYSYREVYFVHLQDNYCRMIYPDENHALERGNYEAMISRHFHTGRILPVDERQVRKFLSLENLRKVLKKQDTTEYTYQRSAKGISAEWCLTSFTVSERDSEGNPLIAIMMVRSIDTLMRETQNSKKQLIAEALSNMSDGFFIYRAVDDEKVLYANPRVLQIYGCETIQEFRKLVNHSFRGMVHPDDLERVEWQIHDQLTYSRNNMDYIQYRIIRKDGEVRWIDDCGHLENATIGAGGGLFYVFISDITDTLTEGEKNKLIKSNKYYKKGEA